jgi:hypothetical protein
MTSAEQHSQDYMVRLAQRLSTWIALLTKYNSADGDKTDPLVQTEQTQIQESIIEEKAAAKHSGWIELFRPGLNLRWFTLALCLPAIQQFTGINAITYCTIFDLESS